MAVRDQGNANLRASEVPTLEMTGWVGGWAKNKGNAAEVSNRIETRAGWRAAAGQLGKKKEPEHFVASDPTC